jgi:hypothetical protein
MLFFPSKQERLDKKLLEAAQKGNLPKCQELLAAGANVTARQKGSCAFTPLHFAVREGKADVARLLLEKGATDVFTKVNPDDEWAAIHFAAYNNRYDIIRLLLEHFKNPDAQACVSGKTAMHIAAAERHTEIVQLLLEHGASRDVKDKQGNLPESYLEKDAALKRLLEPLPAAAPEPEQQPSGWKLLDETEVAHIAEKPEIGYRITEIFNFGSQIYTRLAQNIKTGSETQVTKGFDEFGNRLFIEQAQIELEKQGGKAPDRTTLYKPAPVSRI